MFERKFQKIATNGIELNTVVEGEGPLVILLHGFPQCAFLWRHQIDPIIQAGFRVAVPDQRGYGSSDAPIDIAAYNIRELANDAAGIGTALEEDSFIVIGHDWGAVVAWHTALLHEQTCKAVMALSVPYSRNPNPDSWINPPGLKGQFWYMRYFQEAGVAETHLEADIKLTLRAAFYALSGEAPDGTWMAQVRHPDEMHLLDVLPTPSALPSWLSFDEFEYYVQFFEYCGFSGPINWYRNIAQMNTVTPELNNKQVAQPSAFLAGSRDPVLQYGAGTDMVETMKPHLADLRFATVVEGAGHWVQNERPDEVTHEILRFLELVR